MPKNPCDEVDQSDDPLDQTTFYFDEEQMRAFLEALENPPAPNEALRSVMARLPPWEDQKP